MSPSAPLIAPLIEVRGLGVQRRGRPVLHDLDLVLQARERLFVLGPCGIGKSTLLLTLLGFVPACTGTIRVFDRERRNEADFAPLRGPLGLLFQDSNDQLFGPTVIEDAAFGPLNQGLPAALARQRAAEALHRVGIGALAERAVHELSGGEQRLAALAGVLAMQPTVLLLDEPTASLDPDSAARVSAVLAASGLPMVVASHDSALVDRLATRRMTLGGEPAPAC